MWVQTWLQRFAWTEQNLDAAVKQRNALPLDKLLLDREPMFCFETAVKLLYWCGFVYEHQEVSSIKQSKARSDSPRCPCSALRLL